MTSESFELTPLLLLHKTMIQIISATLFKRYSALQNESVVFERWQHLPVSLCLIKDVTEMHYGKSRILYF